MAQFLAESPLPALLGILFIFILGIVLLVGYLVFSVRKRHSKKSQAEDKIQTNPLLVKNSLEGIAPQTTLEISDPEEPSLSVSSQSTSFVEARLNLAILAPDAPNPAETPLSETKSPPESNPSSATSRPISQPPSPQLHQPVQEPLELLRLLQDEQGHLIVEVADKRYRKLADITDKKVGQYILRLTAHLLAFTNGMIVTDAGMKSLSAPKVGQTPEAILSPQKSLSSTLTVPQTTPEAEAEFLASLRTQSSPQTPPPKQKRGMFGFGTSEPTPSPSPTMGFNLAEEINDIVQNRLRYSPLATTTQIEIMADPGGGIQIRLNQDFYNSPDDVSDQAARELIKESIKEWERS